MRRLVRIMLLAVLGALAWVVARELLAEAGEGEVLLEERSNEGKGNEGKGNEEKSREELYAEAKRLGIEGRSKMNKDQLEKAIAAARSNQNAG
jgi:hypothetical protein